MTQLLNSAEGGTVGTTVSTGNSGGSSGNAFDAVTIGTGSSLTYNSGQAAHGHQSLNSTTPVSATNSFVQWGTSLTGTPLTQAWFRIYVYLPSLPSSTTLRLARAHNGATFLGSVAINSAGKVVLLDTSGTTQATSTTTLPTGQFFRLEGFFIGSATVGQIQCEIFTGTNSDGVTPTETVTTAATINTANTITALTFGNPASVGSYSLFMDDLAVSSAGYMGPVITLTSTFEGGTSGTTITTGNSGPLSGNAFDVVTIGSGGTCAFSAAEAAHGSLSANMATAGAFSTFAAWNTSIGTPTQIWFRAYLFFTSLPSAVTRFFTVANTGGVGLVRFNIGSSGKILVQNDNGTTITTSTATVPTGQWFRVEGMALLDPSAGQTEVKLFTSPDGSVPAETDTSAATQATLTGTILNYAFGPDTGTANQGPFWIDDIGLSNNGYLGPVLVLQNTFEGGTSGTSVTTGNSGGTSGSAFDVISSTAGQTVAYDSTLAVHGSLSCKLATAGTGGQVFTGWTTSLGTQQQVWIRLYLYFTANPGTNQRVFESVNQAAAAWGVVITTGGAVESIDASGLAISTTTATIPLNQWFRIEAYAFAGASTGFTQVSLYASPDSVTPTETNTSAATKNTSTAFTTYRFGHGGGNAIANLGPWWQDDIGISTAAYLGPTGSNGTVVGTTPVLLGACPVSASPVSQGQVTIFNGSAPIFLGGPDVTPSNGAQVTANTTFKAHLFSGDQIWACTATGTSAVTILQTGV